jgi:hypothetical protein
MFRALDRVKTVILEAILWPWAACLKVAGEPPAH